MSADINMSSSHKPRRKKYIDTNIQGRLIAALLLLEVVLFTVAMWFVYQELQTAIDSSLYRVHKPAVDSAPILFNALVTTVPWVILVNVLMLVGIDQLWGKHLGNIIKPLRKIITDLNTMDLRTHPDIGAEHKVLDHARDWIVQERERCNKIRKLTQSLPDQINLSNSEDKENLSESLKSIKRNLP